MFSEDNVLPLDQWVFNANGHPFPIKGTQAYQDIANIPSTWHNLVALKEANYSPNRIQPSRNGIPTKGTLNFISAKKLSIRNVTRLK